MAKKRGKAKPKTWAPIQIEQRFPLRTRGLVMSLGVSKPPPDMPDVAVSLPPRDQWNLLLPSSAAHAHPHAHGTSSTSPT